MSDPPDKPKPNGDEPLWRRLLAFIIALAIVGIGIWLLVDLLSPVPVAAAFTRVGGDTRVETALEASRFWQEPPPGVVMIPGHSSPDTMLQAARCAMIHDVPLLFTSPDPKGEVNATITTWKRDATNDQLGFPVWDENDVDKCQEGVKLDISELSTLKIPGELSELPKKDRNKDSLDPLVVNGVTAQDSLAPMVVFAAAKAPGDPPDIAVGLALAAHMARAQISGKVRPVSVVVVPRYLEADPNLENQLRNTQGVQGGIVLGEPNTMPEDTRTLLRQLLTSTDQQSFLAEAQTTLGSVGPLLAALLALFGLRKVIEAAPRQDDVDRLKKPLKALALGLKNQALGLRDRVVKSVKVQWEFIMALGRKRHRPQPTLADWLRILNESEKNGPVTIRLIYGWEITAPIPEDLRKAAPTVTIMRLEVTDPAKYAVLVRVEDIQSIRVPLPKSPLPQGQSSPGTENTSQAPAGASRSTAISSP